MRCPVCLDDLTIILRTITGQRTGNTFRLRGCFRCGSMFNPSGYKENDEGLQNDRDYLVAHHETHLTDARELVATLMEHHPAACRLLDIGAGIGTLVMAAQERGLEVQGVEVNPHAVECAARKHGVHLRGQEFRAGLFPYRFDIVTCNHVLEHLEAPRVLIADALASLMPDGLLFLSVPFLPEPRSEALRYVVEPDSPGSPFFDNDVHITHFTRQGLLAMARSFGLAHSTRVDGGLSGYIFRLPVQA